MRMRRGFERAGRRPPLVAWGLLRPLQRRAEHEELWRERVRQHPSLRRELRSGFLLQLVVVGGLVLGCGVLLVQSLSLIASFRKISPQLSPLAWFMPTLVAGLGFVALRRFVRVLAELRKLGRD